jgi:cellulose synthase/poly-beta-1,6-N-acetylglucosamine synthase-like glycosyltransferase
MSAEVAVVIPTRARETRLRFALEALAEQTLDRSRFEVLVVRAPDSNPPFATAPGGLEVRFLRAETAGPAVQRNLGWRASAAPLIAFTDDDCRPEPAWLEQLLAGAPGAIVQGRTYPDPDERHLLYGLARSVEIEGPSAWFETCNIAYPRAVLEAAGGFDEAFPSNWGEDTDLGLRAQDAGAAVTHAPAAAVRHAVIHRTLPAAISEARRREALALLLARHPRQRSRLPGGVFANRTHARLALAAAGAAALPRTRLGWLAIAPYPLAALVSHLRSAPRTPRSLAAFCAHLPPAVALDVAEVAATVRGAIRHRSPVI